MNIIMFAVSALLAFFCCCSVTARPLCSSILPPDPPSTCAVLSPAAQIALKVSTRQGMLDLGSLLRNISATVTSRPDFTTWFMNSSDLGHNFNPRLNRTDLHALGRAGQTLKKCFFPGIHDITLAEIEQRMSCQSSDNYADQMISVLRLLPEVVANFKNLTTVDSRISPSITCTITSVECLETQYPSTRSSDGLPFTDDQDRLRKMVNTLTSLNLYLQDLYNNLYWNQQ